MTRAYPVIFFPGPNQLMPVIESGHEGILELITPVTVVLLHDAIPTFHHDRA